MKRRTLQIIVAPLTFVIGICASTSWITRRPQSLVASKWAADEQPNQNKSVSYKGVSFSYNSSLSSEIKAEVRSKTVDGKPGDIGPRHIAFSFLGSYALPHESPFFSPPEIYVYPIAEYRKVFAETDEYIRGFGKDLDHQILTLKSLLAEKPNPKGLDAVLNKDQRDFYGGQIPFVPMIDAHQMFRSHVKYVDFQNGKGILFLTQFAFERTLISNQALVYIYQGLTNDGKYYISAAFPVAAPVLPKDFSDEVAAKYNLPYPYMFTPTFEKSYKKYVVETASKLEELPPGKFNPRLELIEELIRSLNVKGQI